MDINNEYGRKTMTYKNDILPGVARYLSLLRL